MLVELSVMEQRYHAVMEVVSGERPGMRGMQPHWHRVAMRCRQAGKRPGHLCWNGPGPGGNMHWARGRSPTSGGWRI
jgi:hypothetical protein